MGFKTPPKTLPLYALVLCTADAVDYVLYGFIVLLIVACVLHGCYHVVDLWLCIVWVVSCC